jgi:hypothetical protein
MTFIKNFALMFLGLGIFASGIGGAVKLFMAFN